VDAQRVRCERLVPGKGHCGAARPRRQPVPVLVAALQLVLESRKRWVALDNVKMDQKREQASQAAGQKLAQASQAAGHAHDVQR